MMSGRDRFPWFVIAFGVAAIVVFAGLAVYAATAR